MDVDYIKDITNPAPAKQHKVRLNGDIYESASKLPAGVIRDIMKMRSSFQRIQADMAAGREVDEEQVADANLKLFEILDIVLLPESAERFAERMKDPVNPIDMGDVGNFINWMMEEYGDRPTKPSASSPGSPPSNGMSSTVGLSPEESMLGLSTSPI